MTIDQSVQNENSQVGLLDSVVNISGFLAGVSATAWLSWQASMNSAVLVDKYIGDYASIPVGQAVLLGTMIAGFKAVDAAINMYNRR